MSSISQKLHTISPEQTIIEFNQLLDNDYEVTLDSEQVPIVRVNGYMGHETVDTFVSKFLAGNPGNHWYKHSITAYRLKQQLDYETLWGRIDKLCKESVNPHPKGRGHLEGASSPLPKTDLNNPALKDRVFFHWITLISEKKPLADSIKTILEDKLTKQSIFLVKAEDFLKLSPVNGRTCPSVDFTMKSCIEHWKKHHIISNDAMNSNLRAVAPVRWKIEELYNRLSAEASLRDNPQVNPSHCWRFVTINIPP